MMNRHLTQRALDTGDATAKIALYSTQAPSGGES